MNHKKIHKKNTYVTQPLNILTYVDDSLGYWELPNPQTVQENPNSQVFFFI